MSIEKHPTRPGWYYVKHYPHGRKEKPERTPVEGYDAAKALDDSIKKLKGQGSASNITTFPRIQDVIGDYLLWAKNIRKLAPITLYQKGLRFDNHILPYFGKYRIHDLDQTILDGYASGMKPWQYIVDLNHLFALISWMVKRKHAKKLDWEPEKPTGHHAIKPVPHPTDLLKALDSVKKEKYRILFKLMLYTGLRWNEARNIKWEDIDLRTGSIRIKEIIDGPQDIIYIPEPLHEWFTREKKENGYVFESDKIKGKPVYNIWHVLNEASKICGTHLSNHSLRHASGTYLYEQTDDIYKVQAHLRHVRISTSQIYTRMSIKRRKAAVNSVIDYIENEK